MMVSCIESSKRQGPSHVEDKELQLQLNNYHKITLCVRLDAQEGRRPSIKLIRANVRGTLPKTSVRSLQESEPQL